MVEARCGAQAIACADLAGGTRELLTVPDGVIFLTVRASGSTT